MVAILQIPQLKIFPSKDKRYEGAPQEMLFNGKSKTKIFLNIYYIIYNYIINKLNVY